jgi:hypothetical protein
MISDRTLQAIVDDLAERFILDPSEVPPSMSGFAAEVRRVLDVLTGDELRDKDELTRLGEAKDYAMRGCALFLNLAARLSHAEDRAFRG